VSDLELDNRVSRIDIPGSDGGDGKCAHSVCPFQRFGLCFSSDFIRRNDIRYNDYKGKKLARRLSSQAQQIRKEIQPFDPKVAQELAMSRSNGFIEAREQFQPLLRNPRHDCPPILALPATGEQGSLLKPVQQPRNIRVARHHPVADLPARKSLGGSAQNAQDVVLRRSKVLALHDLREPVRQGLRRPKHFKVRDLLRE